MIHINTFRELAADAWSPAKKSSKTSVLKFYPQMKWMHIACVLASASLFAFRGALIQADHAGVAQRPSVRWCSYSMDSGLLIAGLLLVSVLHGAMFASAWLSSKLVLLGVFLVLGTLALKRAATPRGRCGFFPAALLTSLYMLGAARMHHPLVGLQERLA